MKRLIALILAAAMLLGLAACGNDPGAGKPQKVLLSPESTAAQMGKVKVELSDFVLDGEAELTVTPLAEEKNDAEGVKVQAYDISVGDMHELGDYITIRIPYDDAYCEPGQDPARCVGAKYLNASTGKWEDVLYEVDAAAKELVIYTDHLSTYGAFHVKNEGKRSAYITDVYSDFTAISEQEAVSALREMSENGGDAGQTACVLGAQMLNNAFGSAADAAGVAGSGLDIYGTALNLATLGDPAFSSDLAKNINEGLGYVGKAVAMVKIGATMLRSDKTDSDILGLYKDCTSLALSFGTSAAMGLATGGLYIFDQIISRMFEDANTAKLSRINAVYLYFNSHDFPFHKAKTLKDWRARMIQLAEQYPESGETVRQELEREIDSYCNEFWSASMYEHWNQVLGEVVKQGGQWKDSFLPENLTAAEQQAMVDEYKALLYKQLVPVSRSVENYFQKKAEAACLKELNRLKEQFNQVITLRISEDAAKGETSQYAGYTLRFAPLAGTAVKENWTGRLQADGTVVTKTTLIGFLLAGKPTQVQVFPPNADPDRDAPELTVSFALNAPITDISLASAPPLEDLVGLYEDGVMIMREVYVSEELKAAAAAESSGSGESDLDYLLGEDFEGCDLETVLQSLEEQIGVPSPIPFQIFAGDTPDTGSLLTGESKAAIPFVYRGGKLYLDLLDTSGGEDFPAHYTGELTCSYINGDTGISVQGVMKVSLILANLPEDSFYILSDLTGTRTLG